MARPQGRGVDDRAGSLQGRLRARRHRGSPRRLRRLTTAGLILQHSEQGPPGHLRAWLAERGIAHAVHRAWADEPITDARGLTFVAVLGSANSVNDTHRPWVADELTLLRSAVAGAVPVLGLCWGGQALAVALGGRVGPAVHPENGWQTVDSRDPAIPAGPWLHFHSESFSVPPTADQLAHTPAGPAAFRAGPHLALQFHPEADGASGVRWGHSSGLSADAVAALARDGERWSTVARGLAFTLFDAWYAGTGLAG